MILPKNQGMTIEVMGLSKPFSVYVFSDQKNKADHPRAINSVGSIAITMMAPYKWFRYF